MRMADIRMRKVRERQSSNRVIVFQHSLAVISLSIFIGLVAGCQSARTGIKSYNPNINPSHFRVSIDNPYFSLKPGTTFSYTSKTEDGTEANKVVVTEKTRIVMGVTCRVVWDRVWLDNELIEETYDWYAQDKEGNVWYFGEDSKEYKNGKVASTEGSWESGVNGAMPGIVMPAKLKVGVPYRQEYYKGEAEDMAEVLSLSETVKVPYGSFDNCIKTKDWTPLSPGVVEYKYYSSTTGGVVLETEKGNTTRVELVDINKNTKKQE